MIIKYGDTDITEMILEYERKANIEDEIVFLLGNTPSYELDLKLDNETKILQTLSGDIKEYADDGTLKGTYLIYEAPEKYTDVISLVCFDYMLKANIPYDSKLVYPTTIKDQLDEISSLTGLAFDYSNLENLNQEVNWWDNTVSCRNYIGWMAEINGTNCYADASGKICFKELSKTSDWQTEDVETYEVDEVFTVSAVRFDNGILSISSGDDTGNTLYLSSNNPYIDTVYNPIQQIYDKYHGLAFVSLDNMRIAGLDNLMLFNVVDYQNTHYMCLDLKSTYRGGEYQIQEITGKLETKNADKVANHFDPTIKIKKIEVNLDQNTQKLQIVAKEQEDQSSKITAIELEQGKIEQRVQENIEVATDGVKKDITEQYDTALTITKGEILSSVEETYTTKTDTETIIDSVKTDWQQTADGFEMDFSNISELIEALDGKVDVNKTEIQKFIRFIDGRIELGQNNSSFTLTISNDRISFKDNGVEVAYISNSTLYITDAHVTNSLRIGDFAWVPTSTSLGLKYIGGDD